MDLGFKQCGKCFVDQTMALYGLQTLKAGGHDFQVKVPLACALVPHVRAAVIAHLKMLRPQSLSQQTLDVRGGRIGKFWHIDQTAWASVRDDSHKACSIANAMNAAVSPKTLKFTQARSLTL
jgi:hypothetical protein